MISYDKFSSNKSMYQKILDLNKTTNGWNSYAEEIKISYNGKEENFLKWQMYYINLEYWFILSDRAIKRLDEFDNVTDDITNDNLEKFRNSINICYKYVFEPKQNNEYYSILKEYIANNFLKIDTLWKDLFERLYSENENELISKINWIYTDLTSDQINIIKSLKGINKFNI